MPPILSGQPGSDRQHTLLLKNAVETLHERTEAQARLIESQDVRMNEQAGVNLKAFQGVADLRGDFTQHRVHNGASSLRSSYERL